MWHVVYLKTAIHKELKGTGEDLSQNDRDNDMRFRTDYGKLKDIGYQATSLSTYDFSTLYTT